MAPTPPSTPRNPRVELSPHKRTRIVSRVLSGFTHREVANAEGVSPGSVSGIISRYKRQKSARSNQRPGRPRKISARDRRAIMRCIGLDPFVSLKNLATAACPHVSTGTLKRELIREGIMHRKAVQRPYLTDQHALQRLEFGVEHLNKPLSFWRRILFTDESSVERGSGARNSWVFRPYGKNILPIIFQL